MSIVEYIKTRLHQQKINFIFKVYKYINLFLREDSKKINCKTLDIVIKKCGHF